MTDEQDGIEQLTEHAAPDPLAPIIAANNAALQELDQNPDVDVAGMVAYVRLGVLTDLLWPQGSPLRHTYEAMCAMALQSHIEQAQAQVARDKLTVSPADLHLVPSG